MPEDLAVGCQSAALVVGEAKAFAAELFLLDSILLEQVLARLCLVAIDLASEGGEEELEWEELVHGRDCAG